VLMSIKPEYGYKIVRGVKRFELRRCSIGGKIRAGDVVFLYFSYPVKALVCVFVVGRVYEGTRDELCRVAAGLGDVGLEERDWEYLDSGRPGMMIEIRELRRIKKVPLRVLRERFSFNPPRSYHIVRPDEAIYRFLAKRVRG